MDSRWRFFNAAQPARKGESIVINLKPLECMSGKQKNPLAPERCTAQVAHSVDRLRVDHGSEDELQILGSDEGQMKDMFACRNF